MPCGSGRSTCKRRVAALSLITQLALAAAPGARPAFAQDAAIDAKNARAAAELRAHADAAMDGGAFADAIASYRASYELSRNAALLYNIGSAYERLGDYAHALAYLEQFSRVAPADLKDRVPRLDQLIEGVRGKLARVVVRCNVPGARVLVRGAWKGTTPLATDIVAMPGPARVEVVADGHRPFRREVMLSAGEATHVDAMLVDSDLFAPRIGANSGPVREGGGITAQWWFWTGLGVVATATVAVVVVALTHDSRAPSSEIAGRTAGAAGRVGAALVTW